MHNVLGLRFANRLFEPVWSNQHIDRVEITFDETLALEGRAKYYDGTGALVDMLQNHLLQLLCLVAMDPPSSLEGDDLRDRKVSVLRSVRAVPEESVRARYAGYVDEEGVDPSLETETFAEITLLDRQLAVGGRAVRAAVGQGARRGPARDRRSTSSPSPTWRSASGRRPSRTSSACSSIPDRLSVGSVDERRR